MPHHPKDHRKSQLESIAKLKKQIRDTERLLKRPNLPPHIQIAQQRKLKALQQLALPQAIKTKKEDSIAGKYKMVKFFEKKKVLKRLKQAQSTASQDQDNEAQSIRLIDTLKMQLNYIAHFPRGTPYISLFPRNPCTDPSVLQAQNAIMSDIEKRVKAGELEDASAEDQNISESCCSDEGENEVVKAKGSNKKDQKAKTEEPKAKKNRRDEEEEPEEDEEDSEEYSETGGEDEEEDDDEGVEPRVDDDDDSLDEEEEDDDEYSSEAQSSDEEEDDDE